MENANIDESDILGAESKRICEEMGFESIQIIATAFIGDHTKTVTAGHGNWHARHGSVDYFLRRSRARMVEDIFKGDTDCD